MRKKSCHLENEVMDCLKADKLSPEIKKHISECPYCKDVAAVHKWMKQLKNKSFKAFMSEKTLPDAVTIWNRVQAKRRPERQLVKKALRPLIYPRVFSYLILIIGVIFLLLSNLKQIGNTLASSPVAGPFLDSFSRIITPSLPLFLIPMFIVFISMLFCVLVVALEKLKKTAKDLTSSLKIQ